MKVKEVWLAWHEERKRFKNLDTEGFIKDLTSLEAHIKKLIEVAPKDSAGWPVATARNFITKLQNDHARFKKYLDANTS